MGPGWVMSRSQGLSEERDPIGGWSHPGGQAALQMHSRQKRRRMGWMLDSPQERGQAVLLMHNRQGRDTHQGFSQMNAHA